MTFQFKRDKSNIIKLQLAGDIDLEVTPEIKTRLNSQLEDAIGLHIDARNVSYIDSSGVSILIIAMHMCQKNGAELQITAISDEVHKVLQLARLDKLLPIGAVTGPAQIVDVDVFTKVSTNDATLAQTLDGTTQAGAQLDDMADNVASDGASDMTDFAANEGVAETPPATENDDDLIAALADGLANELPNDAPDDAPETASAAKTEEKAKQKSPAAESDGGGFKPGTFS